MDLAPKEVTAGLLEGISTFVLQWTFELFATRCCFDLIYLSLSVDNAFLCHRKERKAFTMKILLTLIEFSEKNKRVPPDIQNYLKYILNVPTMRSPHITSRLRMSALFANITGDWPIFYMPTPVTSSGRVKYDATRGM